MGNELPWNEYARDLGYKNEQDLLIHWPGTWNSLAHKVGVDPATIRHRRKKGCMIIGKNGGNNRGPAADRRWYLIAKSKGWKGECCMLAGLLKMHGGKLTDVSKSLGEKTQTVRHRLIKLGLI